MNWLARALIFNGPVAAGTIYFDLDWKVVLFVWAANIWGFFEGYSRH